MNSSNNNHKALRTWLFAMLLSVCGSMTVGATNSIDMHLSSTEEVLKGDANGDGVISMMDVIYIINYILGKTEGEIVWELLDLNGDTVVNMRDVLVVINIILNSQDTPGGGGDDDDPDQPPVNDDDANPGLPVLLPMK